MQIAQDFLSFVRASPSPFHAVDSAKKLLVAAGWKQLDERKEWKSSVEAGGRYFFTRNDTALVAFAVPSNFNSGNGFNIIAAHTDSPCLKLKPNHTTGQYGYNQVGVQTYGGGLWNTWFDRDLKCAGRVVFSKGDSYESKLVNVDKPVMRIPTLCIHLNREIREVGFKFNYETHLIPVASTTTKDPKNDVFISLIAEEAGCKVEDLRDYEICLADHQPPSFGGLNNEFLFAPRLDNLLSCFCSVKALIEATTDAQLEKETNVLAAALFDNEEVGSQSVNGAASNLLEQFINRVTKCGKTNAVTKEEAIEVAIRRSFLISADMAHAVHPNYSSKHESKHQPAMHAGIVIKTNANQRYATNSITGFLVRELASLNNIPIQEFVVRNDSACGSTVGPMLSARGLRTVDVGAPQLSMHSIREMMGTDDVEHSVNLFKAFYEQFTSLDSKLDYEA